MLVLGLICATFLTGSQHALLYWCCCLSSKVHWRCITAFCVHDCVRHSFDVEIPLRHCLLWFRCMVLGANSGVEWSSHVCPLYLQCLRCMCCHQCFKSVRCRQCAWPITAQDLLVCIWIRGAQQSETDASAGANASVVSVNDSPSANCPPHQLFLASARLCDAPGPVMLFTTAGHCL